MTNYKRPEDQYLNRQAPSMIKQLEEEAKIKPKTCGKSHVQPYKMVNFNNVPHAGILVHTCAREPNHKEQKCKCASPCDVEFLSWK